MLVIGSFREGLLYFRDPSWGIRDIRDLKKLAEENNITLLEMVNN